MRSLRILCLALALGVVAGCTVSLRVSTRLYERPTTHVSTTRPPPPVQRDPEPGNRPTETSVWVAGHWEWTEDNWNWVGGRWMEPRPGHVWEPPVAAAVDGDYRYYPGYFRPAELAPPPIYRIPDQIQIHAPSAVDNPVDVPARININPNDTPPVTTLDPALLNPTNPNLPTELTPTEPALPALSCTLPIVRVPRDPGYFSIAGTGFTEDTVLKVGGEIVGIRDWTATTIDAQTNRAGNVRVVRGEDRAECGALELF